MIISLLNRYYDIMAQRGDAQPEGYSVIPMNYLVCLTREGKIDDIIDRCEVRENKKAYPTMELPERTQKSAIEANIVEHRPNYIFGLTASKDTFNSEDSKAKKSHDAFVKATLDFFADIDSPLAQAYYRFAADWRPAAECENENLIKIVKGYNTARFAFCLSGYPTALLHEDSAVRQKWEREYARKKGEQTQNIAPCSILGEELPVAVLHDKIKGLRGGQASGCVLVCFNNEAENSYGKKQALNSNISVKAMKKYTAALNFLLSERAHHTYMDAMTVVHFAMERDEKEMLDFVNYSIFEDVPSEQIAGKDVEIGLSTVFGKVSRGSSPDSWQDKWDNADYCLCGLVPNSSRIAVKFCYYNTFGNIRKNVEKYHADFAVANMDKAPPFWKIKKELQSYKASNAEIPPAVSEKLLQSMLAGTPFPTQIFQIIIRRLRGDPSSAANNLTRIGLLKACLIRINKKKEEMPTMALNLENKNTAYLCGRAFAVLEKIQLKASNWKLNKTILDTYFSSACATPASVFPRLLKLYQTHIVKLNDDDQVYHDKMVTEILDDIEDFPKTLTLEEQGRFILGYFQQKRFLYTKKINSEENYNGSNQQSL